MKVVDAVWEKRNLGVNTLEITLEKMDEENAEPFLKEEIENVIEEKKAEYVVIKFDTNLHKFLSFMTLLNFSISEIQFFSSGLLKDAVNISNVKKFNNASFICKKDNSREMFDLIMSSVKNGVFDTDRIALDRKFGIDISNNRYANWMNDLFSDEKKDLRTVFFGDEFVGFLLGKSREKTFNALLGGVLPEYKGLYGFYTYATCFKSLAEDYKRLEVAYSSNNLPIVRLYQSFQFPIVKMQYVFVKHF